MLHFDGVACTEFGILTTSVSTADLVTFDYQEIAYFWRPDLGEFEGVIAEAEVLTSPEDDDRIRSASMYECIPDA